MKKQSSNFLNARLKKLFLMTVCTSALSMVDGAGAQTATIVPETCYRTPGAGDFPQFTADQDLTLKDLKSLRAVDETDLLKYYTYPFNMPDDPRALTSTVVLREGRGTLTANEVNTIREKVNQIIVRGNPESVIELSQLGQLVGGGHVDDATPQYSFHIQANAATAVAVLDNLATVINSWKGVNPPQAELGHLDVSVAGLHDSATRGQVVTSLCSLIGAQAAVNLESLSLRFMGLTTENLETIASTLTADPQTGAGQNLKRLILSFNDIDDAALSADGVLTELIEDTEKLPNLTYLDLRGNRLIDPTQWNLAVSLYYRRALCPIPLAYNQSQATLLDAAVIRAAGKFGGVAARLITNNPQLVSGDVQLIKQVFHGDALAIDSKDFPNRWVLTGADYENMADFILLMQQAGSERSWQTVDLSDKRMNHGDVIDFLSALPNRSSLTQLKLHGALDINTLREKTDEYFVELIRRFSNLEVLLLSDNGIKADRLNPYYNLLRTTPIGLRNLQLLDLSDNPFGSHGANNSNVASFLGSLSAGFARQQGLRVLKLANTNLGMDDLDALISIFYLGKGKLSFVDLSGNYLTFEGPAARDHFIAALNPTDLPELGRRLVEVNLEGNRMTEATMNDFKAAYKATFSTPAAPLTPATFKTILRLKGKRADAPDTDVQEIEIGTAAAFVERAKSFEQGDVASQNLYSVVQAQNLEKAEQDYKTSILLANQTRIGDVINSVAQSIIAGLPEINPADQEDKEILRSAEVILRGVPGINPADITSNIIGQRAQLLKHKRANSGAFVDVHGDYRKQYFKSLPIFEQKARVNAILGIQLAYNNIATHPIDRTTLLNLTLANIE